MAFKEKVRQYWLAVADNRCQFEYYDEKRGFVECNKPAKHVHHIRGEAETLVAGDDPEQNIGLVLCEPHHVRNTSDEEWNRDFGFHPEVGHAYKKYRDWVQQEQHLNEINGRRTRNYATSPFAEVAKQQREMAEKGERYIAGDEVIDRYYEEKMRDKAVRYNAVNKVKKPQVTANGHTDKTKKKHWWDGIL